MKCPIIKVDFTGNIRILTTNQLEKDKYNTENTKISASGGIQHLPEPKVLVLRPAGANLHFFCVSLLNRG